MPSEHLFGDVDSDCCPSSGASLHASHPKAEGLFGRRPNAEPAQLAQDAERKLRLGTNAIGGAKRFSVTLV